METSPVQVFVRNHKGRVWGPLEPTTVELLVENGLIEGRIQISQDGVNFAFPGRFPELREYFPRELWGDAAGAAGAQEAEDAQVISLGGDDIEPPAAPMARPGARAAAPRAPARPAPPQPVAPAAPAPLPPSGDLSQTSAIHLYYLAAAGQQTVLITFALPDREISIHFRRGNPEHVGSDHTEDAMGPFLLKEGLVTAAQLRGAEDARERFGGEIIGALFGTGVLNPGVAFPKLAQRAQGLLLKALTAESGTFQVEAKELASFKALPLGNRWAVLSEAVRRIAASELRRRLQPVMDLPVMKSGGNVATQDLRLTPQETRALSYIDGVRSLAQLVRDLPQDADNLIRLAFFLRDLEAVSFGSTPVANTPPPPQPAAPPPPPPPAGATAPRPGPGAVGARPPAQGASGPRPGPGAVGARPPAQGASGPKPAAPPHSAAAPAPAQPAAPASPGFEAQLKELRARAAKLKEQNLFQVLDLTEQADAGAIKLAYFKLARVYHPDTIPPGAPEELAKLKGDIFGAVGDAYRRLSDDKARAEYLEELRQGGSGEKVDIQQILLAEETFQKGCILVKARKFPEAVKMLDEAIKANEKEGEFYAWRAYARFFCNKDRAAGKKEADRDFQIALKLNERVGATHYFIGHIAKLMGDEKTALKEFKKAVEYQPDHIDAQRELRLMNPGKR